MTCKDDEGLKDHASTLGQTLPTAAAKAGTAGADAGLDTDLGVENGVDRVADNTTMAGSSVRTMVRTALSQSLSLPTLLPGRPSISRCVELEAGMVVPGGVVTVRTEGGDPWKPPGPGWCVKASWLDGDPIKLSHSRPAEVNLPE